MKHLDYSDRMPGSYEWFLAADTHVGNPWYSFKNHTKKRDDYIRRIMKRHKNVFLSHQGDGLETICNNDKRFRLFSSDLLSRPVKQRMDEQKQEFIDLFQPYADKILYIGDGNHELALANIELYSASIAKALGVDYSTYTAIVHTDAFDLVDWHGDGNLQSQAFMDPQMIYENECRSVKKRLARLGVGDTDFIRVAHHFHKNRLTAPGQYLRGFTDKNDLKTFYSTPIKKYIDDTHYVYDVHDRYYVASGCLWGGYIEGATDYVEQRGFPLNELGWQYITVKNDKVVGIQVERM